MDCYTNWLVSFQCALSSSMHALNKHQLVLYTYFSLAELQRVEFFLMEELIRSNTYKDPHFNLSSLACIPPCSESITAFIQMVTKNFPFSSEQEALEWVIQLIFLETTLEAIGIRQCIVLAYKLIRSLMMMIGILTISPWEPSWWRGVSCRCCLCFVVCVRWGRGTFPFCIKWHLHLAYAKHSSHFNKLQNISISGSSLALPWGNIWTGSTDRNACSCLKWLLCISSL